MDKVAILFSGGLDSRVVIKLMKESGFKSIAVYIKIPFANQNLKEIKEFCKKEKTKLKIIDCTKGKFLQDYLRIIKFPKHQRGKGYNPCIDCKIFMYKQIKKFAEKNKIYYIATGEVLGQRPLSQSKTALKTIEKESKLQEERIIRPLIQNGISGRKREPQILLAKKYKIRYPNPSGGCLLCEKTLKNRFKILIQKNLITNKTLSLVNLGRHLIINNNWFVIGRNESENNIIEKQKNSIKSNKGKPAVYYHNSKQKTLAKNLQKDFSKDGKKEFINEII